MKRPPYDLLGPLLVGVGVFLYLAFCVKVAIAADVTLTWTNPTGTESCVDAGPLTNAAGTRIWQLVEEINDPTIEAFTISAQLPGEYSYVATTFDTSGVESRISGKAVKTVVTFIAVAGSLVHTTARMTNAQLLLPVGNLTADTECIVGQRVNNMYAVPQGSINWSGNIRPAVVFAQCE